METAAAEQTLKKGPNSLFPPPSEPPLDEADVHVQVSPPDPHLPLGPDTDVESLIDAKVGRYVYITLYIKQHFIY